jgi:hypothetical protein
MVDKGKKLPLKKSGKKTWYLFFSSLVERISAPWRLWAKNPKTSPMRKMPFVASEGPVTSILNPLAVAFAAPQLIHLQVLAPPTVMYLPFSSYPEVMTGGISQQALVTEAMVVRIDWTGLD